LLIYSNPWQHNAYRRHRHLRGRRLAIAGDAATAARGALLSFRKTGNRHCASQIKLLLHARRRLGWISFDSGRDRADL
jgi:hypothetical protein